VEQLLKFQEEYSSKLPTMALLTNLVRSLLSPELALAARGVRPMKWFYVKHFVVNSRSMLPPLPVRAPCEKRKEKHFGLPLYSKKKQECWGMKVKYKKSQTENQKKPRLAKALSSKHEFRFDHRQLHLAHG
jgi:hypothetical protein